LASPTTIADSPVYGVSACGNDGSRLAASTLPLASISRA